MKFNPRRILCYFGLHRYHTFETTSAFYTEFRDVKWSPIRHFVWYQYCSCCGARKMKDTVKKDSVFCKRHNGVEWARTQWVEQGWAYLGNNTMKHYTSNKLHVLQKGDVKPFTIINGGKQ